MATKIFDTEISKTLNEIGMGPVLDRMIMKMIEERMGAERIQAIVDKELEARIQKGINDEAWDNHHGWLRDPIKSKVQDAIVAYLSKNDIEARIKKGLEETYKTWKGEPKQFQDRVTSMVREYMYKLRDNQMTEMAQAEVHRAIEEGLGHNISEFVQRNLAKFFSEGEKKDSNRIR